MTFTLTEIPLSDAPADAGAPAEPTKALAKLPASRRTVLRGVTVSALTVGALALTWGTPRGQRAAAETGPGGLKGWDRNDCKDAYPSGYFESPDDDTSQFRNSAAACFGSVYISSVNCVNGWFRTDTVTEGGVTKKYSPYVGACGPTGQYNAWRWQTPDGKVYRCGDGEVTVTDPSGENTYFAICRAQVTTTPTIPQNKRARLRHPPRP
jgi:hypothetical protein